MPAGETREHCKALKDSDHAGWSTESVGMCWERERGCLFLLVMLTSGRHAFHLLPLVLWQHWPFPYRRFSTRPVSHRHTESQLTPSHTGRRCVPHGANLRSSGSAVISSIVENQKGPKRGQPNQQEERALGRGRSRAPLRGNVMPPETRAATSGPSCARVIHRSSTSTHGCPGSSLDLPV